MVRGPKIKLYSNQSIGKIFFMAKPFITFYLIQYHKKTFYKKLFLSVYSILQTELYVQVLVKNHSQISALACLESVANKKSVYLEKKQLVKKSSTRRINFQLAKFTFQN